MMLQILLVVMGLCLRGYLTVNGARKEVMSFLVACEEKLKKVKYPLAREYFVRILNIDCCRGLLLLSRRWVKSKSK